MTATAPSIFGFSGFTRMSGGGQSKTATYIGRQLRAISAHRDSAAYVQLSKYAAARKLKEVASLCSGSNWGGNDEEAISVQTVDEALTLLNTLPQAFNSPEITPEPNGAMAFEWRSKASRILVVSVSGKGIIEYAALSGPNSFTHGRNAFAGELPDVVFRLLEAVRA